MTEINPTTPTTNSPKAWQYLSFAERVARRLRQKLNLDADAETTITRYLERTLWTMHYDMSTARGGSYDSFPAGIREMLRTAWKAGFKAAREAELTKAALRVASALEGVREANETGELHEVERAMLRLAAAHTELLRAAQEYRD